VPLPLLPVVGACGADWRLPLLVVEESELELVVVPVVVVVVVVAAAVAPLDEALPAYEAAAA
jgi:hypothetical protein